MKPLFFASGGDVIFGAYHPAVIGHGMPDGIASPMAVVICPPFGQEGDSFSQESVIAGESIGQVRRACVAVGLPRDR